MSRTIRSKKSDYSIKAHNSYRRLKRQTLLREYGVFA